MDQILKALVLIISMATQFMYGIISALVGGIAKGDAIACVVLAGILAPFALVFWLLVWRGRIKSTRR